MGQKQSKATVVTLDAKMMNEVFSTPEQKNSGGSSGSCSFSCSDHNTSTHTSSRSNLFSTTGGSSRQQKATVITLSQKTVDEVFTIHKHDSSTSSEGSTSS